MIDDTDPRTEAVEYSTAELRRAVMEHRDISEILARAQQQANAEIREIQRSIRVGSNSSQVPIGD